MAIEVNPLRLALLELPESHPEGPGRDGVHGFLVRAGDDCILVDTGVGAGSVLIDRLYAPERTPLADALAQVGASPGEITGVVNTHLHFDHCGNNASFPGVPILVQRSEREAATQAHYTVPEWVDFPGARYVEVDGTRAISDGVELVATPGHTPGHQSLVLRAGDRTELIVGQAAYTAREFELFRPDAARLGGEDEAARRACIASNATWSESAYVESLARLHALHPDRAFFSHDPTVWTREP